MTWRFQVYETLASTSDTCRERAEAGERDGLVVLAKQQTSARGSRGRTWDTAQGNLAFSFLLRFPPNQEFLHALPFLSALAVYDGIASFLEFSSHIQRHLVLKWPNDLLLFDKKMAGILIETGVAHDEMWVVVGIGANLRSRPHIPGRQLTCLADYIEPPNPLECAHSITRAFAHWRKQWHSGGIGAIHQAWLLRAHPLGTRLIVKGRDTQMSGQFSGLDTQGRLLLTCDDGSVTSIVTGDILCG